MSANGGSKTEVPGFARHVRFTLRSRHRQHAPGMSVWCQHLHKRAGSGARPFEGANISPSEKHAGAMDEFMREFAALEPQPPELQQLFRTVHGN